MVQHLNLTFSMVRSKGCRKKVSQLVVLRGGGGGKGWATKEKIPFFEALKTKKSSDEH